MLQVKMMWGNDLSQVSWRVKPSTQELPDSREIGENNFGDTLNISSALQWDLGEE